MSELTDLELANLRRDAKFIQLLRENKKKGMTITATRPIGQYNIMIDKIPIGQEAPINDALFAIFKD